MLVAHLPVARTVQRYMDLAGRSSVETAPDPSCHLEVVHLDLGNRLSYLVHLASLDLLLEDNLLVLHFVGSRPVHSSRHSTLYLISETDLIPWMVFPSRPLLPSGYRTGRPAALGLNRSWIVVLDRHMDCLPLLAVRCSFGVAACPLAKAWTRTFQTSSLIVHSVAQSSHLSEVVETRLAVGLRPQTRQQYCPCRSQPASGPWYQSSWSHSSRHSPVSASAVPFCSQASDACHMLPILQLRSVLSQRP